MSTRRWWNPLSWFGADEAPAQTRVFEGVDPDRVDLGADYAGGPVSPRYDARTALSSVAAFPYVHAATMLRSAHLAGRPLRLMDGPAGNAREIDQHPLLDLLNNPSATWTGLQLRQQLDVDLLTGNAYVLKIGRGSTMSLLRLHPGRVKIDPDRHDGVGAYVYDDQGTSQRYDRSEIYHVRNPSWQDDPRGLHGTGPIESLHDQLQADQGATKGAATLAARPRPDIILSPKGGKTWSDKVRAAVSERLNRLLKLGGTLVLGMETEVSLPSWTPRDMEYQELHNETRRAVLAVTGVPPHMLGMEIANYALAREQELAYWGIQQARAAMFEDAFFGPLAREFGPRLRLVHSFDGIPALEASKDAQIARAGKLVDMGYHPDDALKACGLEPPGALRVKAADPVDADRAASILDFPKVATS